MPRGTLETPERDLDQSFDETLGHALDRLAVIGVEMGEFLAEAVFESAVGDLAEILVDALGGGRERAVEKVAAQRLDLVVHHLLAAVHLGEPELSVVLRLLPHLLDAVEIDAGDRPCVGIEIRRHGEIDEEQLLVVVELGSAADSTCAAVSMI